MFCGYCGKQLPDGSAFCIHCGGNLKELTTGGQPAMQPAQQAAPAQPVQPAQQAAPAQQATPVQPVQQAVPVQPVQPVQQAVPVQTVQPAAPAQGAKLAAKKKLPWLKFVIIGAAVLLVGAGIASFIALGGVNKINSRIKSAKAANYLAELDYSSAIATYQEAIRIDESNVQAYLGLAQAYVAQGDYEEALDVLSDGIHATGSSQLQNYRDEIQDEWDEINRRIRGHIYINDVDLDNTNNVPLVGASISIISSDGDLISLTTDDRGFFDTEHIGKDTYTLIVCYDGFASYEEEIKANKGAVEKELYLEPLPYVSFYGMILEGDEDTYLSNNYGLADAEVTISKINGAHAYDETAYTDYNGNYEFFGMLMGVYEMTVHKDGYADVVQTVYIYEGQEFAYNSSIELLPDYFAGEGYASGTVYDAVTGDGVENLTLNIRRGLNTTEGEIVETIRTDSYGQYTTPALDSGNYCIEIVDERGYDDGYISTSINVKVLGNTTISNQDATVSTWLLGGQLRIVLSWGERPYDLDSHMYIAYDNGLVDETAFYNREVYLDGIEIADLDLDDTDSYGPETTTIYEPVAGTYTFSVHNYSGDEELYLSGATVQVYLEGAASPSYVFYVPNGAGDTWEVFSYDTNTGILTPHNYLQYGYIDPYGNYYGYYDYYDYFDF